LGAFTVLPVALRIEGRRCLVVGGGRVAEQKIAHLLEAGADVTVVSPVICEALARAHSTGRLTWRQGTFIPDDLAGVDLVSRPPTIRSPTRKSPFSRLAGISSLTVPMIRATAPSL